MSLILLGCAESPQFELLRPEDTGIAFKNEIVETGEANIMSYQYMYNGAGVALGDINNDGRTDIFFVGNSVPSKLFLNQGDWKFEDITNAAEVQGRSGGWRTGVSMVDINGDGRLDIYVCYSGNVRGEGMEAPIKRDRPERSNELYINLGNNADGIPTFAERAKEFGLDAIGTFSSQAYFLDYDRDGDLDMFLVNHANMFYAPFFNTSKIRKKRHPYFGNQLYQNNEGVFKDVSANAGIHGSGLNFGLSATIADFNNDFWPDIYVTNDYDEQDFFYINNHDGTFKETAHTSFGHISKFSMGSDMADVNNDGYQDFFVVDMLPEDNKRQKLLKGPDSYDKYNLAIDSGFHRQNMRNMLHINAGPSPDGVPVFQEVGQMTGISNTDWSWSTLFADFNNDCAMDLFVTNGYLHDYTNMDFLKYSQDKLGKVINTRNGRREDIMMLIREMPSTPLVNYCFAGKSGTQFSQVNQDWGIDQPSISNGAAYGDLDNDGDLDLVVNNLNQSAFVYRNNIKAKGNYIQIKLEGRKPNTLGIGARIRVELDTVTIHRELYLARGYQSSVDPVTTVGLGDIGSIRKLSVTWQNGEESVLEDVAVNQLVIIEQTKAKNKHEPDSENDNDLQLFKDVTATSKLNFVHRENHFSDFHIQRLMPYQPSRLGGQSCTGDINGDGLDDIYFGGASGQAGVICIGREDSTFAKLKTDAFEKDAIYEDIGSAFFDADGDKDLDLYVVSGGYEFPPNDPRYQDRLYLNNGRGGFEASENALPPQSWFSGGKVTPADFDNDGDIDLFVGGRMQPGHFPRSPRSQLLMNESKTGTVRFTDVTQKMSASLVRPGMVTDAKWTDLNHDGWQDLVLVGEWMPIRVFANDKGTSFKEMTHDLGLSESHGWWSGILADDLDHDGDIDFIVGNAGSNLQYGASPEKPLELFLQDLNDDQVSDPIISYYIGDRRYPIHSYDEMVDQMRSFRKRYPDYESYSGVGIDDLIKPKDTEPESHFKINYLKSSWVENANGKMILRPLPDLFQKSMLTGILKDDFDGDGVPEILCVGNFYPYRVEWGPSDSFFGGMLEFKNKELVIDNKKSLMFRGDIRDAHLMRGARNKTLMLISRNDSPAGLYSYP